MIKEIRKTTNVMEFHDYEEQSIDVNKCFEQTFDSTDLDESSQEMVGATCHVEVQSTSNSSHTKDDSAKIEITIDEDSPAWGTSCPMIVSVDEVDDYNKRLGEFKASKVTIQLYGRSEIRAFACALKRIAEAIEQE